MSSIFRKEALAAQQTKPLGEIVLIRPASFGLITAWAVAIAASVILFLIFGSYTKRSTVAGQLVPSAGLVKIYAPQPGIVLERHVSENQQVKAGEVLFVVSSERHTTIGDTQAAISEQVTERQASLRGELAATADLQRQEGAALLKKIEGVKAELGVVDTQIAVQRDRVALGTSAVASYRGLLQENFISQEQLQQKQEVLLDQQARLHSLERDRIGLAQTLAADRAELAELSSRNANQITHLNRELSTAAEELSESEARRRLVVTAPAAGTATAVLADVGQAVDRDKPLVSIIPAGSRLKAELYAPSRAIGFVRPGDQVLLRYQAYPYQKFGHQVGTVTAVSKTALPRNELPGIGRADSGEPLYRIQVLLASQTIQAYGQPQPLQAGMMLEADVLLERRRLYEWILDPLYGLSGRV